MEELNYCNDMKTVANDIPGYTYGTSAVDKSPVSLAELGELKRSAGFTLDDEKYLRLAGDVLSGQTQQIVDKWRGIIAESPHLARHSRTSDGKPIETYSKNSGLRFQQWIVDTCLRPYDQDWLNYQHEIALRHTTLRKNRTDEVQSTPYVPLRDIVGFAAVINDTIKPFLAARGHSLAEVEKMHTAWCKSVTLQIALWAKPYSDPRAAPGEW